MRIPVSAFTAVVSVCGLLLASSPPARALVPPIADPAALPAENPPLPDLRNNGGCVVYGVMPGFDPAPVPPSQAMLNLEPAWKLSRGAGVIVAVIDSGVTPQPRLTLVPGTDLVDPPAGGTVDCDGHGTAVAGIVAGAPGPDGFSGVAPEARIMPIRQMSAQWTPKIPPGGDPAKVKSAGDVRTLTIGIRWAADHGARVINISEVNCILAVKDVDQKELGATLHYAAVDKDVLIIAAAGNTGGDSNCQSNALTDPNHPEDPRNWTGATMISTPSYWQPYVLSVGSLTPTGTPSGFTMAGPWVGIAAPGEQIVSLGNGKDSGLVNGQPTTKEPMAPLNGTSYAAPYVAGVAALIRSRFPKLTWYQVMNRLTATAHNSSRAPSNVVGAGVLDPLAALTWDIPEGPRVPTDLQVVRAAPPVVVPRNDPRPALATYGLGVAVLAGGVIAAAVIGWRRGRQ